MRKGVQASETCPQGDLEEREGKTTTEEASKEERYGPEEKVKKKKELEGCKAGKSNKQ